MLLATIDSFAYRLVFLLHIASVIVAFAPAFVWPVVSMQLKKAGRPVGPSIGDLAAGNTTRLHGPALGATGLFGILLILLSDDAWKFDQTWVSIAFLLWFVMLGVLFGLLLPAERKAAVGDEAADKRVGMAGGMLHLLLFLMLVDMIWKPGL